MTKGELRTLLILDVTEGQPAWGERQVIEFVDKVMPTVIKPDSFYEKYEEQRQALLAK